MDRDRVVVKRLRVFFAALLVASLLAGCTPVQFSPESLVGTWRGSHDAELVFASDGTFEATRVPPQLFLGVNDPGFSSGLDWGAAVSYVGRWTYDRERGVWLTVEDPAPGTPQASWPLRASDIATGRIQFWYGPADNETALLFVRAGVAAMVPRVNVALAAVAVGTGAAAAIDCTAATVNGDWARCGTSATFVALGGAAGAAAKVGKAGA